MKNRIVIAEYMSTGFNFVADIISRGYEPVLLECKIPNDHHLIDHTLEVRESLKARLPKDITVIPFNEDYNVILEQVRAVDPILIIPGNDFGVPYSCRLSADLGLLGNPVDRIPYMTRKDMMHQALKEHGLRYIRGKNVTSEEEALAWYEELDVQSVVVKRVVGLASTGVYLCNNKEDMLRVVRREFAFSLENTGKIEPLLIQEMINGSEFIVNTVSCQGRHRMVSLWEYEKMRLPSGTNAYIATNTINRLGIGHSRLISYAFDVADAIGVQYGAVHGEFMVDEKGPVLIEVNCRPIGLNLDRKYLERLFGHHETDCILDSYLDPHRFQEDARRPYRPLSTGTIKNFVLPKDMTTESAPIISICRSLKSYYSASFPHLGRTSRLHATTDLFSSVGTVYLQHADPMVVQADRELLHNLEINYPDLLFQNSSGLPTPEHVKRNIQDVIAMLNNVSNTLVFTDSDEPIPGVVSVREDQIKNAYDSYEFGILDLSKPESFGDLEIVIRQIYEFTDKIRVGGYIIIPESTYCHIPYGMEGMEILLQIAGLTIEAPRTDLKHTLIASVG